MHSTCSACDQVDQLIAHGWWFSPGIPASSTTNTCRHDIAEILLKVALSTINQIKSSLLYVLSGEAVNTYFVVIVFGLKQFMGYNTREDHIDHCTTDVAFVRKPSLD